eukprot:COSAG05_NODE_3543_length_2000_cov_2.430300_3_plen_83_part_00
MAHALEHILARVCVCDCAYNQPWKISHSFLFMIHRRVPHAAHCVAEAAFTSVHAGQCRPAPGSGTPSAIAILLPPTPPPPLD